MALILNLETATNICSVVIAKDAELIAAAESDQTNSHASQITLFIERVAGEAKLALKELDAIAVSKGPGSYTGLRIGVSTAKGLCYALGKPLIAVDSLRALAYATIQRPLPIPSQPLTLSPLYSPMIDARRMEAYTALYDAKLTCILPPSAQVIDKNFLIDYLKERQVVFAGNAVAKCKALFAHPNAVFMDDINCSAKNLVLLAEKKYKAGEFENIAYFEPFYLKSFEFRKSNG